MASFKFGFDLNKNPQDNNVSPQYNGLNEGLAPSIPVDDHDQRNSNTPFVPLRVWSMSEWLLCKRTSMEPKDLIFENVEIGPNIAPLRKISANQSKSSKNGELFDGDIAKRLEEEKTDLIPGEYEGGAKVWECSLDLCRYLTDQLENNSSSNKHDDHLLKKCMTSPGVKIWEMGCGHGLPACLLLRYAVQNSIKINKVLFSDYNDFVLRRLTCYNIFINSQYGTLGTQNETGDARVIFDKTLLASGDWMDLSYSLQKSSSFLKDTNQQHSDSNDKFELILAAETTYTHRAAHETASLISRHLCPIRGVALIASKRFYFGVGGGSDSFKEAIKSYPELCVTLVQEYDSGKANIRDLFRVSFKPKN